MARQESDLLEFEEKYEDLVDLLCWAAKEGVHGDMEARYSELREWMTANYCYIRPQLLPYWTQNIESDNMRSENVEPQFYDPFEILFAAERVDQVINAFSGISALISSREAIVACYAGMER